MGSTMFESGHTKIELRTGGTSNPDAVMNNVKYSATKGFTLRACYCPDYNRQAGGAGSTLSEPRKYSK